MRHSSNIYDLITPLYAGEIFQAKKWLLCNNINYDQLLFNLIGGKKKTQRSHSNDLKAIIK